MALVLVGAVAVACAISPGTSPQAPTGREYHVAPHGDDKADGAPARPLRTIGEAAKRAEPGDVITVHAGVYRERVDPPRGGTSDTHRIVYRAAPGEEPVLEGAERVQGWRRVQHDTWHVELPNSFFGDFNPFADVIAGDWFDPRGRTHHTGAVYLDDHWLYEASSLEHVLQPIGARGAEYAPPRGGQYLLNVAWLGAPGASPERRVAAAGHAAQHGVQTAPCSEGGECIGWIESGDWVRYDDVDLGDGAELELRVASATAGGLIEIRRDGPDGALLGTARVPPTGDWQRWVSVRTALPGTGAAGARTLCLVFRAEPGDNPADVRLWWARVDERQTAIWAQFPVDPNTAEVEVNVRRTVFYPSRTGIDFLTVRGFRMQHAATPWAPPTAEQIGLIGTNWSKGWIIEHNDVRYSVCSGIALGKHGDEFDNTSADTAEGYVATIERALARGWTRERVGHHLVRNNRVRHCEQAGIVGSLGAAFCTVSGNEIHDVHVRRLFSGAEMAAIKFHGAIDTVIEGNHIFRCNRGIWLDWMNQGSRTTRNLVHDVGPSEDLFVEVNHGPFLVDDNLFLSPRGLVVVSQGGAYVHNLIAGDVYVEHKEQRQTPAHPAHATAVTGLYGNPSGDDRFHNNVFVGGGLPAYDAAGLPVAMAGNVFLGGARPSRHETAPFVDAAPPGLVLEPRADGLWLRLLLPRGLGGPRRVVTSEMLGETAIAKLPYEQADGTRYVLDTDYRGCARPADPAPGPFADAGAREWRVWPR
ncbi:MAG: carbohydrate-binding protein [Planctomycetes bacterium]|nr:carbohydrate-binding protein [Planctomycetota bacterium]